MLRLPTIRGQFPDLAEGGVPRADVLASFLAELLPAECDDRAADARRIKAAGFPREKSLRAFDCDGPTCSVSPSSSALTRPCKWGLRR